MKMNILLLHEKFCEERRLIRNFTPATIKWYRFTIRRFLKDFPSLRYVDEITTTHLQRFLYDGRLKLDWSARTFINYYKGNKVFFDWCVKYNHLDINPILGIEMPKVEKTLPKRISRQDAMKLLEYSYNRSYRYRFESFRNRAVIATFIYTGVRSKELLGLSIMDVDLENNVLHVRLGKGNKDRVIPICTVLKGILQDYIEERKRLDRKCCTFFVSVRGDQPFTYSGLKRVVSGLKKHTGVKFGAHALRHTFCTLMLEGGCDLFSLQKMMGHSQISTTTLYLSATVKLLQEQMLKHPLG
jgi:site-specific recombinase XerD